MVPESEKLANHIDRDPAVIEHRHDRPVAVLGWVVISGQLRLDEVRLVPRRVEGAAFPIDGRHEVGQLLGFIWHFDADATCGYFHIELSVALRAGERARTIPAQ